MTRFISIFALVVFSIFSTVKANGQPLPAGKWTIISHGASDSKHFEEATPGDPDSETGQYWLWMIPLAQHIQSLGGEGTVAIHSLTNIGNGTLELEDWQNGPDVSDNSVHHVLVYDWHETSIILGEWAKVDKTDPESSDGADKTALAPDGYAYAAGDALFALVKKYGIENDIDTIIGHSRGSIVASEFARRMFLSGSSMSQVIYLDGEGGTVLGLNPYQDLRHTGWIGPGSTYCRFDNIYSTFAEDILCYKTPEGYGGRYRLRCNNYDLEDTYRHGGCGDAGDPPPIWEYLEGYMYYANGYFQFDDRYPGLPRRRGPILGPLHPDNWDSYVFGDFRGGTFDSPEDPPWFEELSKVSREYDKNLFNGDFSWGSKAGWQNHGGAFDASFTVFGYWGWAAALPGTFSNGLTTPRVRHSWAYMPQNAEAISLDYRVADRIINDVFFPNPDKIVVKLHCADPVMSVDIGEIVVDKLMVLFDTDNTFPIPQAFKGKTCSIEIEYDKYVGDYDFQVFVDNIGIITSGSLPPIVSIESPLDESSVSENVVSISASASDDDRGIMRVEFFIDDVFLGGKSTEPFEMEWNTEIYADGPHTIRARAWNYALLHSDDQVTVEIPERIPEYNHDYAISNMQVTPQAPVVGESVTIQATLVNEGVSTEPPGQPVSLIVDGQLRNVATSTNSLAPQGTQLIQFSWTAQDGPHNIRVSADLYGDENSANDSKETAVVVGTQASLLVDGSTSPARTVSMAAGASGVFNFQLLNSGSVPLTATIAKSGAAAGWVLPSAASVTLQSGENSPFPITVQIPAGTPPSVSTANIAFNYSSGIVTVLLTVRVIQDVPGRFEDDLYPGAFLVDGTIESSQSPGHGTGFFLDNDPATTELHDDSFTIDVRSGAEFGYRYERLVSAVWNLTAREDSPSAGLSADLRISADGGNQSFENDVTLSDHDIHAWVVPGVNDFRISLDNFVHDAANVEWYITRSQVYFHFTTAAWGNQYSIVQSNLDKWDAGWNWGRLYFDVDSTTKPGELYLFNNGRLIDTVTTSEGYFTFTHGELDVDNFFVVNGSISDQTQVTLSNTRFVVDFYEGDPALVATRGLPAGAISVNQTATIALSFNNTGTNIAEAIQYNENPLPVGLQLVAGSLTGSPNDLDPGEIANANYSVRATNPGTYTFGPRLVTYENPVGVSYGTTLEPAVLQVAGGALSAVLSVGSPTVGIGAPLSISCNLTRNIDDGIVRTGIVTCTVVRPDAESSEFVLVFDEISGQYSGSYTLTSLEGEYTFSAGVVAPYYDPLAATDPVVATVVNLEIAPTILSSTVRQLDDVAAAMEATIIPSTSGATCRVVYGLTTGYGSTSELSVVPGTTDTVSVSIQINNLAPGNNYNMQFVAANGGGTALGGNREIFTNRSPELTWTGDIGFEFDGVNPDIGEFGSIFEFRTTYRDLDGDGPAAGFPRVHLFDGGLEIASSPFQMQALDTADLKLGRQYGVSVALLPMSSKLTYRVASVDLMLATAGGDTALVSGPVVTIAYDVAFIATPSPLVIDEGSSASLSLVLDGPPATPLSASVYKASGDSDIMVGLSSDFVFSSADWDIPRIVTVSAGTDVDDLAGQATIRITGTGGPVVADLDVVAIERDSEGCPMGGQGDLNCDCTINIIDVVMVTGNFGRNCGDPATCAEACEVSDIIENCTVDILDVVSVTGYYGAQCTDPLVASAAGSQAPENLSVVMNLVNPLVAVGDTVEFTVDLVDSVEYPYAYQLALRFDDSHLALLDFQSETSYVGEHDRASVTLQGPVRARGMSPIVGTSRLGTKGVLKGADRRLATARFILLKEGRTTVNWDADNCLMTTRELELVDTDWAPLDLSVGSSIKISSVALELRSANPAGTSFEMAMFMPRSSNVDIAIYDARGRLVRRVFAGFAELGSHPVTWDGRDNSGRRVHSGVYFARMVAGPTAVTQRLVWLK